ncbi:glycosyltransferase family 2 protein [Georgenia sp. H159]|uniref:glycosyltransferase family 2 protein n=1 Tax=Georgenia sp. H159 TaxID=3076115 RepID=UPI002D7822D9|nr:glycosyltransferase [Georgenia sp. H159]
MGHPLLSVLTPVYDPPLDALRQMIASVREQTFSSWELILADDRSTDPRVREVLRSEAEGDPRVVVVEREHNGGIVAASNSALDKARGEFVALLDHDDLLVEHAFDRVVAMLSAHPEADYLYSDEDKIDETGRHYDVFRKPDWSPERLRGQMYTSHLSVLRTSLVREVGGFRAGFEGSQDHDLVLRVTERARQVLHLPEVLYHWRAHSGSTASDYGVKFHAWEAGRRAVQDHLDRVGIDGRAELGALPGTYRLERTVPEGTTVSVIIPTKGSAGLVWGERGVFVTECVRSLLERTGEELSVEIVVVHDDDTPPEVLADLHRIAGDRLVLAPFSSPFNFSEKCNVGYLAASGSILVFLNDDIRISSDDFLATLVGPLSEPDVGLTGARLLFADGTLQHGGHQYARGDITHAFLGVDGTWGGPFSELTINRECSGQTAAAAAVRREVFEDIGGFCEALPGNFNDVDLSWKIGHLGYRTVWVAGASAYHFESRTRKPTVHEWEYQFITTRWDFSGNDPYMPVEHTAPWRPQARP